jgi:predicted nuclease of predicted toxin-antitoxin system
MKLLLDQNISFRLISTLEQHFPGSEHVKRLGLLDKTDREIWDYTKLHGFIIVTFDSDFYDLSVIIGSPPKVLWINTGNLARKNLATLLLAKVEEIKSFHDNPELSCLELH